MPVNLPYSGKTKLCSYFLNLIHKVFPPHHKIHKFSIEINVKKSYRCMSFVGSVKSAQHKDLDPTNQTRK